MDCLREFNARQRVAGKEQTAVAWATAAFTGAAFAGKLRKLDHYLKDQDKAQAPAVDRETFDAKLKAAQAATAKGGGAGGAR